MLIGDAASGAQYDHHAFTYFEDQSTLALPVVSWNNYTGDSRSELRLFRITAEDGIEDSGSVDHTGFLPEDADGWGTWCNQVRRSIFIEDYVFAVSNMGVQVVRLDDPSQDVAGVVLPEGGCQDYYGGWAE